MALDNRLTDEIFRQAMARKFKVNQSEVVIESFKVSSGANPGDNFLSDICAIDIKTNVKGQSNTAKIVAKLVPTDPIWASFIDEVGLKTF